MSGARAERVAGAWAVGVFGKLCGLLGIDPGSCLISLAALEALDPGTRERLAENSHARFPLGFSGDGEPLDAAPRHF